GPFTPRVGGSETDSLQFHDSWARCGVCGSPSERDRRAVAAVVGPFLVHRITVRVQFVGVGVGVERQRFDARYAEAAELVCTEKRQIKMAAVACAGCEVA